MPDLPIEIMPMAIDQASNRVRVLWLETRAPIAVGEREGLHTWLARVANAAWALQDKTEGGKLRCMGVKLDLEQRYRGRPNDLKTFLLLRSVERIK